MPKLPGYSMQVHRVVGDGPVAVAELTETVEVDGAPVVTPDRWSSISTTRAASPASRSSSNGTVNHRRPLDEI